MIIEKFRPTFLDNEIVLRNIFLESESRLNCFKMIPHSTSDEFSLNCLKSREKKTLGYSSLPLFESGWNLFLITFFFHCCHDEVRVKMGRTKRNYSQMASLIQKKNVLHAKFQKEYNYFSR